MNRWLASALLGVTTMMGCGGEATWECTTNASPEPVSSGTVDCQLYRKDWLAAEQILGQGLRDCDIEHRDSGLGIGCFCEFTDVPCHAAGSDD